MVSSANERLKKLIFDKLSNDLGEKTFHPVGRSIWIIDLENKEWYFEISCEGNVWYNQKYFNQFFNIFTLKYYEYQTYLKSWVVKIPHITMKNLQRKNTNYDYYLEGIINDTKHKWSIKDRHGFSYFVVNQYVNSLKECGESRLTLNRFLISDGV